MGLYTTTITLEDGSKKFYQHDQPTLAESNYIATETAGGFAYTNSGWNGGFSCLAIRVRCRRKRNI